jgi:uncharacterized protein YwgA
MEERIMDSLIRRVALLVEIADRKSGRPGRLGKTAMQKLVYLLQELSGQDFGYRFHLYTYGPYEAGIMRDVSYAESLRYLALEYDPEQGYEIKPGELAGDLASERAELQREVGADLNKLFATFGDLTARELELRATLVFIDREHDGLDVNGLRERLHRIKPEYCEEEIEKAIAQLQGSGALTVSPPDSK